MYGNCVYHWACLKQVASTGSGGDKSPIAWLPLSAWNDVVAMSAELDELSAFVADMEGSAVRFKEVPLQRVGICRLLLSGTDTVS